jgi:Domain of unknown function (DUF222)
MTETTPVPPAPPVPPAGPLSWLDAPGTRPQAPPAGAAAEAIAAGFTRHPDPPLGVVRGRAGFEAGGPADVMAPCSVLAELTGQAAGRMGELSDDELIGVLRAARRVQSWQAAVELEAVSELTARRMAEPARPGPRPAERAAAEIAAALTLTGRAADALASLAATVERLAGVGDALAAGLIDLAKATVFADELAAVDWLTACCIATRILPDAPGLTTAQLRARLRRAVLAADPRAPGRRKTRAARDGARVETWPELSGNAALAGRELPPAGALAADRHLSALARSLKTAGARGSLDQIRAAVYLALLSGRDPATVLADLTAEPAADAEPGPDTQDGDGRAETGTADAAATPDAAGPGAAGSDRAGRGADTGLAADGGTDSKASGGRGSDGAGSAPEPAGSAGLSWPSGPRGSVHLTMPLSAWLGQTNSPGEIARYGPADAWTCRDVAADLASQARTRYCLTVTTQDGQPAGHACARGQPPPRPGQARQWLAGLNFHWFTAGSGCDHAQASGTYRPGARLAHLTQIRMRTCTAPGCNRPAETCDLDHVIPHDQGGPTCTCNLHPACRRHHQLKQHPGWAVDMPEPGRLTWHLPHGRSYITTSEPYPV